MKSCLDICRSLVDVEYICNLSILNNCDNLHLLIFDWNKIALIYFLHPHVILFLLLIGYTYFGMYFLSDVTPIHNFPSTVIAPKKPPWEIVNIISLCSSRTDIWSICFCLSTKITLTLTNNKSETSGKYITQGWFSIQPCN